MSLFDKLIKIGMPLIPKPLVGLVAKQYVAGETLDHAVTAIRRLAEEGAVATLDVLGESVHEPERAEQAVAQYQLVLDRIHAEGLPANVSVKPTMLGLKIDEELCLGWIGEIVEHAAQLGNFVRIDMEDHTCTDATLRIYQTLQERFGNTGVVLQAYMRRTLADIDRLQQQIPGGKPNIRICKGIYREPRHLAWKDFDTVRANFVHATRKLLEAGSYVGIATHDSYLAWAAMALADRGRLEHDQYELQMLLGVDPELRRIILAGGHRLRIYVPYGRDWYPYSMRRLRENPTIAGHVIRAMLGRHGGGRGPR